MQPLSSDLKLQVKNTMAEFKKLLPKSKKADEYLKDLENIEINRVGSYLVKSFSTFTNPNYLPDKNIMTKAVDYLVKNVILKNKSILIYGDSISAGYGMEKESQWSESLKTLLSDKGFEISVHNRSISGETTGGGLTRISKILDELKPTFLLLELGGNDALRGYPPK